MDIRDIFVIILIITNVLLAIVAIICWIYWGEALKLVHETIKQWKNDEVEVHKLYRELFEEMKDKYIH